MRFRLISAAAVVLVVLGIGLVLTREDRESSGTIVGSLRSCSGAFTEITSTTPCSKPASGVVIVLGGRDAELARVVVADSGQFSIEVDPGDYRVAPLCGHRSNGEELLGEQAHVSIAARQESDSVDVACPAL